MMELNCVIIDDEPLALELLQSYVENTASLRLVGKFSSALQAMNELADKEPPHLMFLDIQMPDLNGIEYSKLVNDKTRIIFTTAFDQYALDSYKVNALDYLLKPISYVDFLKAVNKAKDWFNLVEAKQQQTTESTNDDQFIYVKSDYKLVQINLDKILYIEGLKDYIKIHLENEQKGIMSLLSMKAIENKLPSDKFIRVHRSFIVQKSKIKLVERSRIIFGKEYIPVSDSYKQDLLDYLNSHSV